MYLMYVDESGDPGKINSPTRYFILSAIIFHETYWLSILNDLVQFKRLLKAKYGLLMKDEIHASAFLSRRVPLKIDIKRNDRLDILKKCIDWLSNRNDISIISICIDKTNCSDPFEKAWQALIQRFENTLRYRNFPGPFNNDSGMIFSDNTNGGKLVKQIRQMRRYNPIPNTMQYGGGSRNIPLKSIIEDPNFRDSSRSLVLQLADVVAYFAKQVYEPNKYVLKKGARTFYGRLLPVINKHVTYNDRNYKIVEL